MLCSKPSLRQIERLIDLIVVVFVNLKLDQMKNKKYSLKITLQSVIIIIIIIIARKIKFLVIMHFSATLKNMKSLLIKDESLRILIKLVNKI